MRILVGLSGGVDSSCAAYILKKQGHDVEGAVLRMGGFTDISGARRAAELLGIRLHVIDCSDEFEKKVIGYFTDEYLQGKTPNPCTVCNRYIKINRLCAYAAEKDFDRAATGHYARVVCTEDGRLGVSRAADLRKDQSYMLWMLTQEELSMLCLPLGEYTKGEVKEIAAGAGLGEIAALPESQDVCFIPYNDYARFVKERTGESPSGFFVDGQGKVLGKHKGLIHYTVGQKKGLGIALGRPYTVKSLSVEDNTVCIVPSEEEKSFLYSDKIRINGLNFQALAPDTPTAEGEAKIRYASVPAHAVISIAGDTATVCFDEPQRAPAKGQSLVLYRNGTVAVGGVIDVFE